MIIAIFSAIALQTTAPVAPAPAAKLPATKPASSKVAVQDDAKKMVCRRQVPTGSVIERRICKTQAEWDNEAVGAANFMADLEQSEAVDHSSVRPGGLPVG
jgi:hypothetical protein